MNQSELRHILSAPFDFGVWKSILSQMFPKIEYLIKEAIIEDNLVKGGGQIGTIRLNDGRSLALFKFEVNDNVQIFRNRKSLRKIAAKQIDQSLIHGALVFYYSERQDDYRLTYVAKQTYISDSGELKFKETDSKRFTFLLGENEPCTTAASRLMELINKKKNGSVYLEDVTEAFSVERLNKEFFKEYKQQYSSFCEFLYNNKGNEEFFGKEFLFWQDKTLRDYVKKMLGRITFIYFLQHKGWMNGNKQYMNDAFTKSSHKDDYLDKFLEPLFFGVLNTRPKDRNTLFFEQDWNTELLEEWKNVPYLNGGLFERDKYDNPKSKFPAYMFESLFDFYARYNFTIDENDPDDAEIGVDPEMLGHIFENLLEDNKDKGAFYTPKEIVQYMCRESIAQYLKTHINESLHDAIDKLITNNKVEDALQKKNEASMVYHLLEKVKVCDPAIGSGAFPMGVLNVLYHTRQLLYGFTQSKKDFSPAEVKREIIQNNIFGVDIEQGAVDIARLRFWLALVVDEETPRPLPNLDYKIMCGNSLLHRYDIDEPMEDVFKEYNENLPEKEQMSLEKYKQMVADYTNTSDHAAKNHFRSIINNVKSVFRNELSDKEKNKRLKLKRKIVDYESPTLFERTKAEKDNLKKLKAQLKEMEADQKDIEGNKLYENAFEWRFEFPQLLDDDGNFSGFDIVIGNPPYLRIQGIRKINPKYADELIKKYSSATGSFDLYVTFVENGLKIINNRGVVNYIMPSKWTNSAFGKGLRSIVSKKQAANKMINFGAYQVFNASTYTAMQWFSPHSNEMLYYELDKDLSTNKELELYLKSIDIANGTKVKNECLNKNTWTLTAGVTANILKKLNAHPLCLGDVFEKIFQGIATSKDDIYFLYDCESDGDIITGESKQLGRRVVIERGLVKPLLKGEDVHRYETIHTNRVVIFPYKIENGKAILYTESELEHLFPNGYAYLKECENELRDREKGRFNNDKWYMYGRAQGINYGGISKLVAPEISLGGNFSYDINGQFYSTTKVYGYIKKSSCKYSYLFLLGLLNSSTFWFYIQNTGYVLRGGYYTFKTNYVVPFPIPCFDDVNKQLVKDIEEEVRKILAERDKDNQCDISCFMQKINNFVFQLYEFTPKEIYTISHMIQ